VSLEPAADSLEGTVGSAMEQQRRVRFIRVDRVDPIFRPIS